MDFQNKPLTPEILVPRIGDYLVDRGYITREDLQKALNLQYAYEKSNIPKLLGQILVEIKVIDQITLDQIITEQIIRLKTALEDSNKNLEQRVSQRTFELEAALQENKKLNEIKSNLISNISHELRTPLTHIKGYLHLFIDGDLGRLSEEQVKIFAIMNRASDKLEKLIDELIMFTLGENDELILTIERCEIASIISKIINKYALKNANQQIFFINNQPGQEIWVWADQKKIEWVISQLLENAIKFSQEDSSIQIELQPNDEDVVISVIDHGIGISEEKINEIFVPFHQIDGSSTRKFGGVGLGLALVNKILEIHKTKLTVHSEIGIGSRFDFSLRRLIE
jgi:two-component system OmpR family sensor kinase